MLARAQPAARPGGLGRGSTVEAPAEFFEQAAEAEYARRRRSGSGELYLELHRAHATPRRPRPSRATGAASTCCARPSCGRPPPPCAPGCARTRTRTWTGSGRRCCCTSSTTSCPGSSIAWVHREAEATYAQVARRAGRRSSARAQRALAGDPAHAAASSSTPRRTRRGGVAGRRRRGVAARTRRRRAGGARGRRATSSTTACCGSTIDERRPDHLRRRPRGRPRGDRARRRRQPAPAAPGLPEPLGRLGRRRALPQHRHATSTEVDASSRSDRDGRRAVRGRARASARSSVDPGVTLRAGRQPGRHRHRRRLARGGEVPQGRPSRSTCTPTGRRRRSSSGTCYRPTHTNTSWDAAKFEICAHRWVHVGEPGYGRRGGQRLDLRPRRHPRPSAPDGGTTTTVRLSLLRAPRFPDPETDQGTHRLRYALVAGADDRRRDPRGLPAQPARARRPRATPRSSRWSPWTTTASWSPP